MSALLICTNVKRQNSLPPPSTLQLACPNRCPPSSGRCWRNVDRHLWSRSWQTWLSCYRQYSCPWHEECAGTSRESRATEKQKHAIVVMYTLEANLKHKCSTRDCRMEIVRFCCKRSRSTLNHENCSRKIRSQCRKASVKTATYQNASNLKTLVRIFLAIFVKIFSRQIWNRRIYHFIRTSDTYHARFHRKMWISERICATLTILP